MTDGIAIIPGELRQGDVFDVEWPFLRDTEAIRENAAGRAEYGDNYGGGRWEWKIGTRVESEGGGFFHTECDAMGRARFEVVHVCAMPGRYQDRVFHKRTLIDPDGKEFAGRDLRCVTIRQFKRYIAGWRPEIVLKEEGFLEDVA